MKKSKKVVSLLTAATLIGGGCLNYMEVFASDPPASVVDVEQLNTKRAFKQISTSHLIGREYEEILKTAPVSQATAACLYANPSLRANNPWSKLQQPYRTYSDTMQQLNPAKRRFSNLFDHNIVKVDGVDFISASLVENCGNTNYILTQNPLPNTLSDYVKLLKSSDVVVAFVEPSDDLTILDKEGFFIDEASDLRAQKIHLETKTGYTVYQYKIYKNSTDELLKEVTRFEISWSKLSNPDIQISELASLALDVNAIHTDAPIILQSLSGSGRPISFCAILVALEQMTQPDATKVNLSIPGTVEALKHCKQLPGFFKREQYLLIYQVVANLSDRLPYTESVKKLLSMHLSENAYRHLTPEGQHQCPVCREDLSFENLSGIRILPCGHIFHSECVNGWIDSANSCPICRTMYAN